MTTPDQLVGLEFVVMRNGFFLREDGVNLTTDPGLAFKGAFPECEQMRLDNVITHPKSHLSVIQYNPQVMMRGYQLIFCDADLDKSIKLMQECGWSVMPIETAVASGQGALMIPLQRMLQ